LDGNHDLKLSPDLKWHVDTRISTTLALVGWTEYISKYHAINSLKTSDYLK